jgi:hypothetical protein
VGKIFDLNKVDDSIFRTKNGAPKILTKVRDKPFYFYELLPEYADGTRRLPTVKTMNWTGKAATARVIRFFFALSTPVVQRCPNPRSISRLVIVLSWYQGKQKMISIMVFVFALMRLSSTSASSQTQASYP